MSVPFRHDPDATYGQAERLSERVERIIAPNPGPFTYTGTGTFLVGRDSDIAVIDPGPPIGAHARALKEAVGTRTVRAILVTHTHRDHSPLARPMAREWEAPVLAFGPHGSGRAAGLEDEEVEEGADHNFVPDEEIGDGHDITGDGWRLTALHTPGHTSNHLCFHLREENTLFTGDHIMGWSTTIVSPPDGDMKAYMDSLYRLRDMNFDLLRPTHGPAIDAPEAFIDALIQHRWEREARIHDAVKEGHEELMEIVRASYQDVSEELHGAAARSALAHLIHLEDQGRVEISGTPGLRSRFRPRG